MTDEKKALVLFSGGVDSTTCLAMAIERFGRDNVLALSIQYGQKHAKELEAAHKILAYYGVEGMSLDVTKIFAFSQSSLLCHSEDVIPHASYEEQQEDARRGGDTDGIVTTYVPFRNGLFLSAATSLALSRGCSYVYYGAHSDDAAGNAYPDCSEAFFKSMREVMFEGSGQQVHLEAPFISLYKADVVKRGLELEVPYELTWSCYEGGDKPCGLCGTCIDRAKAFAANGVKDPAL